MSSKRKNDPSAPDGDRTHASSASRLHIATPLTIDYLIKLSVIHPPNRKEKKRLVKKWEIL